MKLSLTLAWRNLWRHPRRTFLTIAAIGFAAGVLIFFVGLQLSSYDAAINASVNVYHGHMQLQHEGYFEKPQVRNTLKNPAALKELVLNSDQVSAVSARAMAFALVSSKQRTYGVQLVGVEPRSEAKVSTVPSQVRDGEYFTSDSSSEVVLGNVLARNLKVGVGEELTILGQGSDGSLAATILKVAGIFETGADQIDRNMIHLPLKVLQETFFLGDEAHSIVLKLENLKKDKLAQKTLQKLLSENSLNDVRVMRWDELLPGLKQAIELDMSSGWIFYFSLVLIVTFSVLNTFLMSVLERTKEFSIMLALGMRPGAISGLLMVESFLLTLTGLLVGLVLGVGVILYFGTAGFYIPGSEEFAKLWNMPTRLYTKVSLGAIRNGPAVILVSSLVATLIPAFRVRWLRPAESLREN